MLTKRVAVTVIVDVTVDETLFTRQFLDEFCDYMYSHIDCLDEHVKYLAWLHSCRSVDTCDTVDGYVGTGILESIKFREIDSELEILAA
jgi:hypothetical protein